MGVRIIALLLLANQSPKVSKFVLLGSKATYFIAFGIQKIKA